MQSRDANRLSDLADSNEAVALYNEDVGGNLGAASTSYCSIPDPSAMGTRGDQRQGPTWPRPQAASSSTAARELSTHRPATGWAGMLDPHVRSPRSPFGMLPITPLNQTSQAFSTPTTPRGPNTSDPWSWCKAPR